MQFDEYIHLFAKGINLDSSQSADFLGYILDDDDISEKQIASALTVLTEKHPTVDEVYGFVMAMQTRMRPVNTPQLTIDTCGTGGDKLNTFNISTAAAILISAGGVPVAKHGNRAATSLCGSADVLQELGIPIDLTTTDAEASLALNNFVFLFAPQYHPSLRRLSVIRKNLGFPTVFNLLGPLLNPAGVKRQVVGTYSTENSELIASVMLRLGYEHGLVLTSSDGLDEASLNAEVEIIEVKGQRIVRSKFSAKDFKLKPASLSALKGGDAIVNAAIIEKAFIPVKLLAPQQEVIILNAGLGFYVAGAVKTIGEGISLAKNVLEIGKAQDQLFKLKVTI
jgi:anthranilate phosphoribosyltransferase